MICRLVVSNRCLSLPRYETKSCASRASMRRHAFYPHSMPGRHLRPPLDPEPARPRVRVYPSREQTRWPVLPNTRSFIVMVFEDEITPADSAGKETPMQAERVLKFPRLWGPPTRPRRPAARTRGCCATTAHYPSTFSPRRRARRPDPRRVRRGKGAAQLPQAGGVAAAREPLHAAGDLQPGEAEADRVGTRGAQQRAPRTRGDERTSAAVLPQPRMFPGNRSRRRTIPVLFSVCRHGRRVSNPPAKPVVLSGRLPS